MITDGSGDGSGRWGCVWMVVVAMKRTKNKKKGEVDNTDGSGDVCGSL
jgi:hypothetical protein